MQLDNMADTRILILLLSFISVVFSAPVTLFETATATTAAPTAATTTATAASVNSGTSSGGLWSSILNWLLGLSDQHKSGTSGSNASSNKQPSLSLGLGLFSWSDFLSGLFGGSSNSGSNSGVTSSTLASEYQTLAQQPTLSAATTADTTSGLFGGWGQGSTSTASTSNNEGTQTASTSQSSGTGGIYDAIYNSDEKIDKDFAKSILDAHNKYRAQHGVGELAWADGPYNYAKNNADQYDCSGVLTHTHGKYGENLAAGFSSGPSAVKAWYDEGNSFNYQTSNEYNHFTQVVWKGSKTVGCAYKDCRSNNWGLYVVCEYDPPGNIIGHEQSNVLKPVN